MRYRVLLQRTLFCLLLLQLLFPPQILNSLASANNTGSRSNSVAVKPQSTAPAASEMVTLTPATVEGLQAKVTTTEDEFGIPHIFARNTDDVYFMQGMLHARDRFFQMDVTRRMVEGTLAELVGTGTNNSVIAMDVQLRAFNFRKAVADTLPRLRPETRRILKFYTRGINAFLMANPLPAEYQALQITQKRLWTETDSLLVAKGLALNLSFDIGDIANTLALAGYTSAGQAQGFDGAALFFEDAFRFAPFDPTFAIPDATGQALNNTTTNNQLTTTNNQLTATAEQQQWATAVEQLKPQTLAMARDYLQKIKNVPLLSNGAAGHDPDRGSNWFVVSGRLTDSGAPLLNNDPHLAFGAPPIWYQIQLNVRKKNRTLLNVTGVSLAGVPGVVLGHNDNLAWAATTTNFDVTDVYQEQLDIQFGSISTIHNGQREPVVFRDETFRANQITTGRNDNVVTVPTSASVPARFPSVPRRNNGPIVSLDLNAQTALSVQYVGTGATFEIETFLDFNRAKSVDEFKKALEFFDVGSQNFAVATTSGDIAYFTTGEVPLREDLEAGRVNGAPPFFIRNGMGGNEWMAVRTRQSNQNLNFELLPIAEMPQTQNPSRGFIVTANNDPVGTTANNQPLERKRATGGIYYLSNEYASGARAARLTRDIQATIASGKKITVEDARRFQASVKMRDAEILLPSILQAFDNARRNGAPADLATLATDPGITQAVTRFRSWDFSTPTGLRIGYDSFVPFNQADPTTAQINASVSATIYSVWRSQIVRDVLDVPLRSRQISDLPPSSMAVAALRNLLDNFATRKGTGASGVTFFRASELASASPEDQRDFLILRSLRRTLDELAGPTYAAAFQNSSDQNTYRWGILHRVSFPNTIGGEFSIPSTSGNFRSPFPGLFGIPRDGGFDVPNASGHDVRAQGVNAFTFRSGPSKRSTFVLKPGAIEFVTAIPGGQSGNLQSRFHDNLLNQWLTADVYPVRSLTTATTVAGATQQTWLPAKKQSKLK